MLSGEVPDRRRDGRVGGPLHRPVQVDLAQRLAAFHVCFLMNDGRRSTSVLVMK